MPASLLSISTDLDLFEQLVQLTYPTLMFWYEYKYAFMALYTLQVAVVWMLFGFHYRVLEDHKFFIDNLPTAGRFTGKTYFFFRWLCMGIAPLGASVIIFSLITRFDTVKFLQQFGVKYLKTPT